MLTAQGQEFARVLRNGEQATLSVFGPRPVDLAAKKLVDEFRVVINVEDLLDITGVFTAAEASALAKALSK